MNILRFLKQFINKPIYLKVLSYCLSFSYHLLWESSVNALFPWKNESLNFDRSYVEWLCIPILQRGNWCSGKLIIVAKIIFFIFIDVEDRWNYVQEDYEHFVDRDFDLFSFYTQFQICSKHSVNEGVISISVNFMLYSGPFVQAFVS